MTGLHAQISERWMGWEVVGWGKLDAQTLLLKVRDPGWEDDDDEEEEEEKEGEDEEEEREAQRVGVRVVGRVCGGVCADVPACVRVHGSVYVFVWVAGGGSTGECGWHSVVADSLCLHAEGSRTLAHHLYTTSRAVL